MSQALAAQPNAALLEQVLISGDLSKLSAQDRVVYYKQVCESVGLNPLTKPFEYITLNGKLTFYALRSCTEQLRQIHGVSVAIKLREVTEGCYVVTASASDKTGRFDESIGAVPIEGLKGEARSNAMMKCETKAKRRVTLSICGLGLLDETEVDSVPQHRITPAAGAMGALPIKVQDVIMATASEVKQLLANDQTADAYALWQDSRFDADQTVAFWSQLDSKQKGVLGRMGEAERAANAGTISPAQHKRLEARIKELGLDRDEVKAQCLKQFGVAHFTELNKEQYALLDASLETKAAPSQVPLAQAPSLASAVDATPAKVAAPNAASAECLAILAAIDLAKSKADLVPLQERITALDNAIEIEDCTAAYNWMAGELRRLAALKTPAGKAARTAAEQRVADMPNDLPFRPTQKEII